MNKKYILSFLGLGIFLFTQIQLSFADTSTITNSVVNNITTSAASNLSPAAQQAMASTTSSVAGGSGPVTVIVTEKIPGANCTCLVDNRDASDIRNGMSLDSQCGDPATRKYSCTVEPGMTSFQNMIREIVRWFVYIIMLLGVLALVGAGILWAWGSESEEYTKKAKGWAMNIIIGLAILFSFRYILGFLAPWIFQ